VYVHAAGLAAAGKGELNYVNYWPTLTRTVAKSLTEWWGRTLVLSPLRESQRGGSETQQQQHTCRFQTDRQTRRAVQVAVWKLFDSLEALTERWPPQARRILNQVTNPTSTKPFQTLAARPSLRQRTRFNAVWTSLVCFPVYAYDDEGSLEEMALRPSDEMCESTVDIAKAEA
jgi:hypothetical protein